jgi:hypothetical protein
MDFRDFYISYKGHPRYEINKLIEDDPINVILQKYEMLILTNKGDIFGQPDFGCDLEEYLFETRLSADFIEGEIEEQVRKFIPEVNGINFTLTVNIYEDPERFQEWMEIVFKIADYEVYAAVGV